MTDQHPIENHESARWTLIRDTAVLQVKLIVDGLRDFLLVPASLIAAIVSLATAKDGVPGAHFYDLLRLGRRSEIWINLFGAFRNAPEDLLQDAPLAATNLDEIVGKVEKFVVDEYKRGGMTAQAKEQIDKALNSLHGRARKSD